MAQQTATDWLFDKLWETPKDKLDWYALLQQANAMEKKQIMDAHGLKYYDITEQTISGEQYYNETFGAL